MSYAEQDTCRLCANDKNLISLYSGKARNMRCYIREMINELLPIQIQWEDASVCFNCSIDVSNFYVFKLDILQKHKNLETLEPTVPGVKRLKLDSLDSKDRPSIEEAEAVIEWLESKRVNLESKEIRTFPIKCDIATQYDVLETTFKQCQTSSPKLVNSASQCDNNETQLPSKASVTPKSQIGTTSKERKSSEYTSSSNSKSKVLSKNKPKQTPKMTTSLNEKPSQTNNKLGSEGGSNLKPSLDDSSCQTDNMNVTDNSSQTEQRRLIQNLFQNSLVTESYTQDGFAQTEKLNLVNRRTQCDILKLNGFKNAMLQSKERVCSKEGKHKYKIANPQVFTDALLNGFDNTFLSKTTQTEMYVSQCNLCKFSHLPSLIKSPTFAEDENKLDIKVTFIEKLKEEKLSPSESLTISTKSIEENIGLLSPRSSDLLQVNSSKTDQVKICKLCDMTLYNKTEVAMHNKTHMMCNICRRKFRSLKATQNHINNCKMLTKK